MSGGLTAWEQSGILGRGQFVDVVLGEVIFGFAFLGMCFRTCVFFFKFFFLKGFGKWLGGRVCIRIESPGFPLFAIGMKR